MVEKKFLLAVFKSFCGFAHRDYLEAPLHIAFAFHRKKSSFDGKVICIHRKNHRTVANLY